MDKKSDRQTDKPNPYWYNHHRNRKDKYKWIFLLREYYTQIKVFMSKICNKNLINFWAWEFVVNGMGLMSQKMKAILFKGGI